ncbi:uncharacterized protein LOC128834298 [Malaclemys terrapin pileata]|uniref:uncharacterized protein LOC128834298 n=1 Tax=Malaclemys terrapin pileata TaxID=2991368 RepID=UPI0023A86B51|nr:uncharacterized protein LOC128834298 [Malaclemys terrapin pileata]XP_053878891.1 uncharacterized protein LOC128834298 [Malaclemys terrapin pileata]
MDSEAGIISSATPEDSADGEEEEEEEEEELAESTQHSVLPNSQDLFLSLTEVPSQHSQANIQDHDPMEGTSGFFCKFFKPPSPRISQIRRRRKRTRDEMFTEIMECTRNERAHLNEWKDTVSKFRKDASEREVMRDARDERWQAATLGPLHDQTDMLRHLVELQERQQDNRLPLQPLYNLPPPSPCSISSSPRRVRTRGRRGSVHPPTPPQWIAQPKGCHYIEFFQWPFTSLLSSSQTSPRLPCRFSPYVYNQLIKNT